MKEILIQKINLEQYLLMEMIFTPILKTYMLRRGELKYIDSVTELGVFSLVIANSQTGKIHLNVVDGLLPRTKQADCDEGGVSAGFAVIDHILLVDSEISDLKPSIGEVLIWVSHYYLYFILLM